jgi:hypothetical protein
VPISIPLAWWTTSAVLTALIDAQRGPQTDYRLVAQVICDRMQLPNPPLSTMGEGFEWLRVQVPNEELFGWVSDQIVTILYARGLRLETPPTDAGPRTFTRMNIGRPFYRPDEPVYQVPSRKIAAMIPWLGREIICRLASLPEPGQHPDAYPVHLEDGRIRLSAGDWWREGPPDGIPSLPDALKERLFLLALELDAPELKDLSAVQAIALAEKRDTAKLLELPVEGLIVRSWEEESGEVITDLRTLQALKAQLGVPYGTGNGMGRLAGAALIRSFSGQVRAVLYAGYFLIAPVVMKTWPVGEGDMDPETLARLLETAEAGLEWERPYRYLEES